MTSRMRWPAPLNSIVLLCSKPFRLRYLPGTEEQILMINSDFRRYLS